MTNQTDSLGLAGGTELPASIFAFLDKLKESKRRNATSEPTDEAILRVVGSRSGTMTYVVRNMFWSAGYRKETPWYLRRLKRLEREGKVERVSSPYAVQICWKATGEKP